MNRRKFFALLPAAPVAIATWPTESKAEDAPHNNEQSLVLCGSKDQLLEKHVMGITPMLHRQNDPSRTVSMAVGQDGNLWIKPKDGEWKQVVTQ